MLFGFFLQPVFAQEEPYPAILVLSINHVKKGDLFVLLTEKEVLVSLSDFHDLGIRGFHGKIETIHGKQYVILSSLAPEIVYTMDADAGTLTLTVAPALLGKTTEVNFQSAKPEGVVFQKINSFFLITR